MGRIGDNSDCDNLSAHFSNQLSTRTEREEDWDLRPYQVSGPRKSEREKQLEKALAKRETEYDDLHAKYEELKAKLEESEKRAEHFREKYEEKASKDRATK